MCVYICYSMLLCIVCTYIIFNMSRAAKRVHSSGVSTIIRFRMDQWTLKSDPLGARNFDNPWRSSTWYSTLPSSKSFCNMKIVSFIHHGSWMLIAGKKHRTCAILHHSTTYPKIGFVRFSRHFPWFNSMNKTRGAHWIPWWALAMTGSRSIGILSPHG